MRDSSLVEGKQRRMRLKKKYKVTCRNREKYTTRPKDMSNEFQVWRQPRGTAGNIILKSDGEPAIPPAKYHGGIVVQERPAVVKANRMDLSRSRENGQGVCVR